MRLYCPKCPALQDQISKFGKYRRKSDSKLIQRYKCKSCNKYFSRATFSKCVHQNKRRLNHQVKILLCSQVSMRRIALILNISRLTVKRKLDFLAEQSRLSQKQWLLSREQKFTQVQFDDLESFIHTKLKPVSLCMVVEAKTRKIIDYSLGEIPAKGLLARKARKKYGFRANKASPARRRLFRRLVDRVDEQACFTSDQSPLYPNLIKKHFPKCEYITFKGVRGCVTGQGELKKISYDPLFSINHTFAMLRANINRLIRKTWCTSKKIEQLQNHIDLYVDFHNQVLTVK